eukprot:235140_1
MGQHVCSSSCSGQYVKGYDDLPDRITEHATMRSDSVTTFKSHKVVTTMSSQHDCHRSKHRSKKVKHKKKRHKKRRKVTDSESNAAIALTENLLPISMNDFAADIDDEMNKTYVLYREGFCHGSDGDSMMPINTITTQTMEPMDIAGPSDILTSKFQLNHIISRTPPRYQIMKWKLFYSLLNDGCSMQTFYGNTQDFEQSLLILKDNDNNIFGAFLDSKWKAEYHHYTGSANCFVYRFSFEHDEYSIFEYHSSGDKPYYVQSDYDGITIGAGECPAIYIANNLLMGRTAKSDTFDSEPLSTNTIFEIQNIEIWCPVFD